MIHNQDQTVQKTNVLTYGWSSIWFTAGTTRATFNKRSKYSTEKLETPDVFLVVMAREVGLLTNSFQFLWVSEV